MPKLNKTGSEIAIIYKDRHKVSQNNTYQYTIMQCTDFIVSTPSNNKNTHLAVINWPPDTSTIAFLTDLANNMERNIKTTGDLILLGDFNIHVSNTQSPDTFNINDFLNSFGLTNKVTFPSNHLLNTLDLIIVEEESIIVQHIRQGFLFLDHHMVHFNHTKNCLYQPRWS